MKAYLARPVTEQPRLFPEIAKDLYDSPQATRSSKASAILALALLAEAKRPWSNARRAGPHALVGQLLHFHRSAFEAEAVGQWKRADFFWTEVQSVLGDLWRDENTWTALAVLESVKSAQGSQLAAAELRRRIADELLIDTHCAFYNGYLEIEGGVSPSGRALWHLAHVKRLVDLIEYPKSISSQFLLRALKAEIDCFVADSNLMMAIARCREAMERFPEEDALKERLVRLYHEQATTRLAPQTNSLEITRTETGIDHLKQVLKRQPYLVSAYYTLSDLYHRDAVALANSGRIADALVAIRWSIIYDPTEEAPAKTQEELVSLLKKLEDNFAQVQAQIDRTPNAKLNEEGRRLGDQLTRARRPVSDFIPADAANRVKGDFEIARARDLWRHIGLVELADEGSKVSIELANALGEVVSSRPVDSEQLRNAWARVKAQASPSLAELDQERILSFLEQRLFSTDKSSPPEPESAIEDVPLIRGLSLVERSSSEPLAYWVFSKRDLPVKLQALAAIILLGITGTLGAAEWMHRRDRDASYEQLMSAVQAGQSLPAIQAAERFLGRSVLAEHDAREAAVRALYGRELLQYVAAHAAEADPESQQRLDRYVELSAGR